MKYNLGKYNYNQKFKFYLDEFIFYSHLGLGDQIILSGAINYLSKRYNKIHLVSYEKFKNSLDLLYKENHNVEMFYLPKDLNKLTQEKTEISEEVIRYSKKTNWLAIRKLQGVLQI